MSSPLPSPLSLTNGSSGPSVICLGEFLLDAVVEAQSAGPALEYPGGAPANVACALTKLGTQAAFVGAIGEDEAGESLLRVLHYVGVDSTGVQHQPWPTRVVQVSRNERGDRVFGGFGSSAVDGFADAHLQAADLPEALFAQAEYLVLGTLSLAYADSRAAVLQALDWADRYYLKVFLDINWRPTFWANAQEAIGFARSLLPRADFLKLSDDEAQWLFGTDDATAILSQQDHLEVVLVTSAESVHYASNTGAGQSGGPISGPISGKIPSFNVVSTDTTGAGDSFVAGFLHQVIRQGFCSLDRPDGLETAVRYGAAAGALTTTALGAIEAQPFPEQISELLALGKA
jgi:fructokinase